MPIIDIPSTSDILKEMLECQIKWHLSDADFGRVILGAVSDPGKIVRGWKAGAYGRGPTVTAIESFRRLKVLVAIANNSPLDAEENYAIAHSALPAVLQ
jgi:hypothetical protein